MYPWDLERGWFPSSLRTTSHRMRFHQTKSWCMEVIDEKDCVNGGLEIFLVNKETAWWFWLGLDLIENGLRRKSKSCKLALGNQ